MSEQRVSDKTLTKWLLQPTQQRMPHDAADLIVDLRDARSEIARLQAEIKTLEGWYAKSNHERNTAQTALAAEREVTEEKVERARSGFDEANHQLSHQDGAVEDEWAYCLRAALIAARTEKGGDATSNGALLKKRSQSEPSNSPPQSHDQVCGGESRNIAGETVCGFRVAAWRETHPEHGDRFEHTYSEHWSTPNSKNSRVVVERLFTETQLREALARVSFAKPAEISEAAAEAAWKCWDELAESGQIYRSQMKQILAATLPYLTAPAWRFDMENAPRDGTEFLAFMKEGARTIRWEKTGIFGEVWFAPAGEHGGGHCYRVIDPTAWMPLPAPPLPSQKPGR